MSNRRDYDTSYGLEKQLAKSIERITENITKQRKLKQEIIKLRRQRRQIEQVPDEVREWFEETEEYLDE